MTLGAFSKLSKINVLKNRVTRVSLDLLYKRITQNANIGSMDLQTFFDAMEELANQVFPGQLGKLDALVDLALDNINDLMPAKSGNGRAIKGYMGTTKNSKIAKE